MERKRGGKEREEDRWGRMRRERQRKEKLGEKKKGGIIKERERPRTNRRKITMNNSYPNPTHPRG